MAKRTENFEIAKLVDDAFDLDQVDSDARFFIKDFMRQGGVEVKREVKEQRSRGWNKFVIDLKQRQKTVRETGIFVKGERDRLGGMLEGLSYGWPEEDTGLLISVVDIYIDGYRATRQNDLGSYYDRTTSVNCKYSEIKGVECEVLATIDHKDPARLADLGLGVVRSCIEDPAIFKGDEVHIFVPADRLLRVPVVERYNNTGTR